MTPLPQAFDGRADQRDFIYRQLQREQDVALFEKRFKDESSDSRFYEVVIIRIIPQKLFPDGRLIETHEAMPKPEDWGTAGWSYDDLESAKKRFNQLIDHPRNAKQP